MDYKLLTWDTDFFGIKTGRIIPTSLEENQLALILKEMRQDGFQFVYWTTDHQYTYDFQLYSGELVDKKITYELNLQKINPDSLPLSKTEPYNSCMPFSQLENLAVQSGTLSRFARDKRFPQDKFISLYKSWIQKSATGEMADEILVIRENDHIIGMVTLAKKKSVGNIGLIAVDEGFRGRKFGQQLVGDAHRWFIEQDCVTARIITQGDNLPACRLYEKCGYQVKLSEFFYHFWL